MTSWAPDRFGGVVDELEGGQLQEDEEMVAEHRLDRGRSQVRDLVGLVDRRWALITHPNKVAPSRGDEFVHRARRKRSGTGLLSLLGSSASEVGKANVHLATDVRRVPGVLCLACRGDANEASRRARRELSQQCLETTASMNEFAWRLYV